MNRVVRVFALCLIIGTLVDRQAFAGSVTVPNTFTSNTPAVATDVNANFSTLATGINGNASDIYNNSLKIVDLEDAVSTLQSQLSSLQSTVTSQASTISSLQTTVSSQASTITTLQANLTAVQDSNVMALNPYLSLINVSDPIDSSITYPTVRFAGLNVQIVNGTGSTETVNGLGNLIIGYDTTSNSESQFCSVGVNGSTFLNTQNLCSANGFTWGADQRSGSHNLILGDGNAYTRYGGLIAGRYNIVNGPYASVSGGSGGLAAGTATSISGGYYNVASGNGSTVSGGESNVAGGGQASVSGGYRNNASGTESSVSGGAVNVANNVAASVCGGVYNNANGQYASVTGGYNNTASGNYASVSGGNVRVAPSQYNWVGGSYTSAN